MAPTTAGPSIIRVIFSALIEDFPEIAAVEINPLMVFDQGKGTMAVDARILFKTGTAIVT